MKKVFFFVTVLSVAFLSACNPAPNANNDQNIQLIERFEEALKNNDYETLGSLLADNYVSYGPSLSDSMKKDDAMMNWKYNKENLYEKLEFVGSEHIELKRMKDGVEQDWISSWGHLFIKYQGHSNEAEIWSNTIYLIQDGKISKSIIFYNEADAMRQAGYSYIFNEPTVFNEEQD